MTNLNSSALFLDFQAKAPALISECEGVKLVSCYSKLERLPNTQLLYNIHVYSHQTVYCHPRWPTGALGVKRSSRM